MAGRRHGNRSGYLVVTAAVLAVTAWLLDIDELWNGEVTAYLVACPDSTVPGTCRTRRIVFRARVREQTVEQLYREAPPFRLLGECRVHDSRNWHCKTLKSGNYTRSMQDGQYYATWNGVTVEHGTWKLRWLVYTGLQRLLNK